jgi:hypothetical protein
MPQWCDIYRWTERPARSLSKVWKIEDQKTPARRIKIAKGMSSIFTGDSRT